MQKILESSVVYRFFAAIAAWFGAQWQKSAIIGRLTTPGLGEAASDNSVFTGLWLKIRGWYASLFAKLRLVRLLNGSIFLKPYVWCFLTVALAPVLPTKLIIALAFVSFFSMFLTYGCDPKRRMPYSPVNKFVYIYAAVYIVATCASVTFRASIYGGAVTVLFVLFSIAMQCAVESRKQLDALIYTVILCGVAVSAYGIYQYVFGITGSEAWLDDDMFSSITTRVYSTLQNPNVLAEYLLLVIPLSFACILTSGGALKRLFFAGCTGVMCVCMLLTYSRGGWLGLIFAMAVFLVILDRRFIILGIVGLIALYFVLPETIISRFTSIGNLSDTSTSYRVFIWMGTIAMLSDYWLCGIGPGTAAFNKVYPLYGYHGITAPHAHNLFLQITCDAGICGLLTFVLMLLSYFRCVCSALKRETDRDSKLLQTSAIASVCGFLVQSATDYSFYNYRVMLMFWAFIALGVLIARRSSMPEVKSA